MSGTPLARLLCHCMICQQVYKQPFADVTAWWAGAIALPKDHPVEFRKHRAPPALRRGTCRTCGAPVVGFLRLAPFVQLAFVPAASFVERETLPAPQAHIFYHRRLADADDGLPRVGGYWRSELAATRLILRGAMGGTRNG